MSRRSSFGVYEGFTRPTADGFERLSVYVTARDGVRLATDVFLPTSGGEALPGPMPAIFQMTPYNRAQVVDGVLTHVLSPYVADGRTHTNNLLELSRHGYVVVCSDVRGQGASFGAYTGCMTAEEGRDGADVVAWLLRQPWCDGKVGMLGSSYGAATQFLTAAERPPGLAALYACHIYFDAYDVFFPGGVRELSLPRAWGRLVDDLAGRTADSVAAPVDGPEGPALLAQALAEHRSTPGASEVFARIYAEPTRDGTGYFVRRTAAGSQNLATLLPELRAAAVPAYHHGGWNDYFPGQTARWFLNWGPAPAKLAIGPWTHSPRAFSSPRDDEDLRVRAVESLRWFDFWLKGVPNGVLDEPPVNYAVQAGHRFRDGGFDDDADSWEWRSSRTWPLEGASPQRWFLAEGPSGAVRSVNDGRLQAAPPDRAFVHAMRTDPAVGTGDRNRMGSSFAGLSQRYPEMSGVDARCLTWTSEALAKELTVAGAPILTFHASSTERDAVFVAWLEDVDAQRRSTVITFGSLKASHRGLGEAPYDAGGDVWHASAADSVAREAPLSAGPARMTFSLHPVVSRFRAGHRIRLTIAGADDGNLETVFPGATIALRSAAGSEAFVDLPLLG